MLVSTSGMSARATFWRPEKMSSIEGRLVHTAVVDRELLVDAAQ